MDRNGAAVAAASVAALMVGVAAYKATNRDVKKDPYPAVEPHGHVEEVIPGSIYLVQGSFTMWPLVRILRTMTIVKTGNDLTIFNWMRVNPEVEAEITALGTLKHLVRLTHDHGADDDYYKHKFGMVHYDLYGPLQKPFVDHTLMEGGDMPVPGAKLLIMSHIQSNPEAMMLLPIAGGTLITVDALQYGSKEYHALPYTSFLGHQTIKAMGFHTDCCTCPPLFRLLNGKKDIYPDFERLLNEFDFENVITGHGAAMVGGAKAAVKEALDAIPPTKAWKSDLA